MLQELTAQLLKTQQLHIPYVGYFHVKQHPAILHFAERLLEPPCSEITFNNTNDIVVREGEEALSTQNITHFGLRLKARLSSAPFIWNGIGTLQMENDRVIFHPEKNTGLLPVPAHKILRENRPHAILVGDQEQSSTDTSFIHEASEKKKTWLWVGWIILLIALLVIAWMFYTNGASFGSKIKAGAAMHHTLQSAIIRS